MKNLPVIFYRNICTTIGFPVVLVLPTLMSAKPVEIRIRLTTLIRHESERNAQSWMIERDLICSTQEFFVVPAFRLIYKVFVLNFSDR